MLTALSLPMLDRFFDDVMGDVGGTALGRNGSQSVYAPAIDVRASEDRLVFVCDVPGLKEEDLDITLEDHVLTIKGERRYEGNEKDRVWLGRAYGAFSRSFTLPDVVDGERMSADLANGVLTITVPKQPRAKPRRIEIRGKQLEEKK